MSKNSNVQKHVKGQGWPRSQRKGAQSVVCFTMFHPCFGQLIFGTMPKNSR
jgi:hypothetical protein